MGEILCKVRPQGSRGSFMQARTLVTLDCLIIYNHAILIYMDKEMKFR